MTRKQIREVLRQAWLNNKTVFAYVNTGKNEKRVIIPGVEYEDYWWRHNLQNVKIWHSVIDKAGNKYQTCETYKIKNITKLMKSGEA